ncbi:stage II sporulation protein R [Paenibacillus sp. CGMCC 1.16610]|uniref:Stage II sporulation protein R n=1 Tax=Paenibacillus anseongense TaxID=2682845 RepID=A0ABW9U399_9BACL|nr:MULTISPECIES: stage II sporulation protein R [Paenibacillus]MBA2942483.1 stage II sporulation protein R [Paenibacillus sp. CGMCC 1.16610]MVQ34557.1 stage II sporulation protein R [Paenibacillus anseongense]
MVKRTDRHSFKHLLFVAFALIVMITSWESNRTNAAVISPTIPEESIRLRILANSDSAQDQALKREIRDAIIERMQGWVVGPHSLDEARAVVLAHLPEFDELVGQMIEARGYSYTHTVELGKVPFPTKMYGNEVYPAGDYEALRVTIGSGEGQNWWCVLFPPLCFVDSVSGEAVATAAVVAKTEGQDKLKTSSTPAPAAKDSKAAQPTVKQKASMEAQAQPVLADATEDSQPKVKFFIWEMTKKIVSWFS